jgi:hypothetical protein
MRDKKAISILKKQLQKIENPEFRTDDFLMETRTYIKLFFTEKSEQYDFIYYFKWHKTNSAYTFKDEDKEPEKKYNKIKEFLNKSIDTIENIGIKKESVDNWFSKLPDWTINLGLPAICFVSFGFGILFTTNNNSELRLENKKLKDKLLLISSDTITKNHKNLSNSPK